MTAAARTKAERCFALARSTKFDGERDNAIAQGTRIAEAAGLSLDLFDIPGRPRKAAPKPEARTSHEGRPGHAYFWEGSDGLRSSTRGFGFDTTGTDTAFEDAFRRMTEALKRQSDELRQQQARERAQRAADPAMKAMHYLRSQGAIVEGAFTAPRRWSVRVGNIPLPPMTDAELIRIAEDLRRATEARDRKRAYEAGRQPERCARCGSIITVGVRHSCPASHADARKCRGGCGKTILFGDSCVDCDRRGFS